MNSNNLNYEVRPILYIIYPYKYIDFLWQLQELDEIKNFSDISILDISPITTPITAENIAADRSCKKEIVVVYSLKDFFYRLKSIRKDIRNREIFIMNEVPWSSPIEIFCNILMILVLWKQNIKVFDLFIGGVPVYYPIYQSKKDTKLTSTFITRVIKRLREAASVRDAFYFLIQKFSPKLVSLLPTLLTHRIVAGDQWIDLANKDRHTAKILVIKGHSHDYSRCILFERRSSNKSKIKENRLDIGRAIFLSSPNPRFQSDVVIGRKNSEWTSDVWYPSLCRFFDQLETDTSVIVDIAGHYKSKFHSIEPLFGNRNVFYNDTLNLVRNSDYVVTINSTAISFACYFKKPILFIYSDQLSKDLVGAMYDLNGLAQMLGSKSINIDDLRCNVSSYLTLDMDKYVAYERAALTSDHSGRPNCQIIIEDIMRIDTKDYFDASII